MATTFLEMLASTILIVCSESPENRAHPEKKEQCIKYYLECTKTQSLADCILEEQKNGTKSPVGK